MNFGETQKNIPKWLCHTLKQHSRAFLEFFRPDFQIFQQIITHNIKKNQTKQQHIPQL